MITVSVNTGKRPFYNASIFLCDFKSDVANLPTNKGAGSKAKVIETGEWYVLNSQHQWVLQPACGSGDGGILPPEDITIIYDGGLVTLEDNIDTIIYDGGVIE